MERLEAIEALIETGREEAPRILAERSREAVEAVEAGMSAALASARERWRPEPRRPRIVRSVLIGLATAVALTILGVVLAAAASRGQRWMRERRGGGPSDLLVREAERASDALERPEGSAGEGATHDRIAIPVGASGSANGMPATSVPPERVTTG